MMRMSTAALASGLLMTWATSATAQAAQPTIPIVSLPDVSAKSADRFGTMAMVRELPGGKVLVDDAAHKQLKLLSSALETLSIVKDTIQGEKNYYGLRIMPLIPYLADSTMFPDLPARSIAVIDPSGAVVRQAAMPMVNDVFYLRRAFTDARGRIIFAGEPAILKHEIGKQPVVSDSAPLIREDFVSRTVDTVGFVARPLIAANAMGPGGAIGAYFNPDPLKTTDEWTVTSDGTIAIVRGHDYRIDFIRADGSKASSPKLPFDWRQLTDADKAKMIDSAETLRTLAARNNTLVNGIEKLVPWAGTQRGGGAAKGTSLWPNLDTTGALISKNNGGGDMTVFANPRPAIDYVFDYYPPIRSGGVLADFSGNVWTLPTTSKQSKAGELVYDIINAEGELVKRVRLPVGRYIVGFGRGGTVYLATGSSRAGFTLERSQLPGAK